MCRVSEGRHWCLREATEDISCTSLLRLPCSGRLSACSRPPRIAWTANRVYPFAHKPPEPSLPGCSPDIIRHKCITSAHCITICTAHPGYPRFNARGSVLPCAGQASPMSTSLNNTTQDRERVQTLTTITYAPPAAAGSGYAEARPDASFLVSPRRGRTHPSCSIGLHTDPQPAPKAQGAGHDLQKPK